MPASWGRSRSLPALLHWPGAMQAQSRADKSKTRKRLRKIADLPPRMRIVFFREQADVVAKR